MSPIAEPKTCVALKKDGTVCGKPAMYKMNAKGFCEEHKPSPQAARAENHRGFPEGYRPYPL